MHVIILLFLLIFISGLTLSHIFRSNIIDEETIWISPWIGTVFIISIILSASFAKIPINVSSLYVISPAVIFISLLAYILKGIPRINLGQDIKSGFFFFIVSIILFNIIPLENKSLKLTDNYFIENSMISKMIEGNITNISDYTVGGSMINSWVSNSFQINNEQASAALQILFLSLLFMLILLAVKKIITIPLLTYVLFFFLYHIAVQVIFVNYFTVTYSIIPAGIVLSIIIISYSYREKIISKKEKNYFQGEEFILSLLISTLIIFQPNIVKILIVILFGISAYLFFSDDSKYSLIPLRIILITIFINPILVGFLIHI